VKKYLFLLVLLLPIKLFAVQDQWYPTADVTQIRMDTYQDCLDTIYDSTFSVNFASGSVIVSSTVVPTPNQFVTGLYQIDHGSYSSTSLFKISLEDWTKNIILEDRMTFINAIADEDEEIYMVYPGTSAPAGWTGWCQDTVNGNLIAVACK
jgi:hypothetical protein